MKQKPTLRYPELLSHITPHRRTLALGAGLLLANSAITLVDPLIAGVLTESLLAAPAEQTLPIRSILLAWLGILAINAAFTALSTLTIGSTAARVAAELRSRVYEHMQILPLAFFQDRRQGDVLTLLSKDADTISSFVTDTLVRLLPLTLTFVLALAIMAWLDWIIALMAALLMPLYFIVVKLMSRRFRPLSAAWMEAYSGMVSLVNENLSLMPVLKAFAREPVESRRFDAHNASVLSITRQQMRLGALLPPTVGLLAGAGALALLWVGLQHLESNRLHAPEFVMLMFYAILLTRPLAGLANVYGQAMRTRGAAERLLLFFAEEPEPRTTGSRSLKNAAGKITFAGVTFAYPGRPPVLQNFDLEIDAGETIGLVGPNGSGKSTVVHLLMRFMDPQSGRILVDGIDIRDVDLDSLRRTTGLVAQNTLLLNGTVAENIAYGSPDANLADIKKAAEAACADAFIENLPEGYDTAIGDQGVRLSGGQRQRLSLARTIMRDPRILVLDEATTMLDPEGERRFLEECRPIFRHRTVILITHRPESLAIADRVVEMPPA